jgi:DNA polymerase
MANKARKLEIIQEIWHDCSRCELHRVRTQVVFWRGNENAKLAFVGEAPGRKEDEQGKPFLGQAGAFLDMVLDKIGVEPWDIFVCNVVGCRPEQNRPPTEDEIEACKGRVHSMLYTVKPRAIVLLGGTALGFFLSLPKISLARGKPKEVEIPLGKLKPFKTVVVPTYHPAYLIREGQREVLVNQFASDIRLALGISQDGSWVEHD